MCTTGNMKLEEIRGAGASHRHVTKEMTLIPGRSLLKLPWKCGGAEDAKQFRKQIKKGEEPACQNSKLPQDSVGLVERLTPISGQNQETEQRRTDATFGSTAKSTEAKESLISSPCWCNQTRVDGAQLTSV